MLLAHFHVVDGYQTRMKGDFFTIPKNSDNDVVPSCFAPSMYVCVTHSTAPVFRAGLFSSCCSIFDNFFTYCDISPSACGKRELVLPDLRSGLTCIPGYDQVLLLHFILIK